MAGRARTNAILDALDSRRSQHFEDDPEATTLDYICEWIANGRTLKALAQDLTTSLGFDVWAETLNRILRRQYGEGAVATALRDSRVRASHHLAEESLEIVDGADGSSSSAVAKANSQARSRQWLAEKFGPDSFGTKSGQNVTINVSQLHLAALRMVNAEREKVTAAAEVPLLSVQTLDAPPHDTQAK